MIRLQLGRLAFVFVWAVCFASLAGCQTVGSGPDRARMVIVAGDGSGDYNCDGTSDQLQINEALAYAAAHPEKNTVYLKGPHTYWINDTVVIGSNTTLTGDKTAAIKLIDMAGWRSGRPLLRAQKDAHDFRITGFEMDGNDKNNYATGARQGGGYYTMLAIGGTSNVEIDHMYLHNNMNDAVSASRCKNIKYHDCVVERHGHDGIQARNSENILVYNNKFINRTNVAIRFADCNHVKAYNNDITAESGGAGIQIQHSGTSTMNDVEVFNNRIYKTSNVGIFVYNGHNYRGAEVPKETVSGVWIHNNVIYDCGRPGYFPGGIFVFGFHNTLIENNTIDGCYGAGIVSEYVRGDNGRLRTDLTPELSSTGFVNIVRNNIITNTKPHKTWTTASGIWNNLPGHSYLSENNCYFGNAGGAYAGEGIEKTGDLVDVDPQYMDAEKKDYRLKETSPCLKKNMGAYGKAAGLKQTK